MERVSRAGVSVMAVTDHDTTAAIGEARTAALECGIRCINGIEITAVEDGRDIHVLGYLFDVDHAALGQFLVTQRAARVARVEAIGARLSALGVPIDVAPLVEWAVGSRSIGRPQVARALMDAGHVGSVQEAFDRWLAYGRPGFVPRTGVSPEAAIGVIHDAGGLASLAHPGKLGLEARLRSLAEAGLDAVEVFHPDHDESLRERYRILARDLGLCATGGSDFHGDPAHGREPGSVCLPAPELQRLLETRRHAFP